MKKIVGFLKTKQGIAVILILFIVTGGIGIFALSGSKDSSKAKDKDIKIAKEKEDKAKKELAKEEEKSKEAEKELEEAKKSGNVEAIKKAEEKLEASKKAVESKKQSVAKASTTTTAKAEPKKENTQSTPAPTPKKKEKVWVVDKPAWTEEVRVPIYVNTWWVKYMDGTVNTFYDEFEAFNEYDRGVGANGKRVGAWGTGEMMPDPSGATKLLDTIHHKEEGHWEER